ncbi:MAG: hypothetical protein K1X75_00290 [Leptospirales bacterium]|nr:hypothetical protein [Leptospirales bacterium]
MRRPKAAVTRVLLAGLLILLGAPLAADTLYLRSGQTVRGKIVAQTRTAISIRNEQGVRSFPKTEVTRVTFEPYEPPAPAVERPPQTAEKPPQTNQTPATEEGPSWWQRLGDMGQSVAGAFWSDPRPERLGLWASIGPLRSDYQSAFDGLRNTIKFVSTFLNDNPQLQYGAPFGNRRLDGYQLEGGAAWSNLRLFFSYSDMSGQSEFADGQLRVETNSGTTLAAIGYYSLKQTLGLRQQNRRIGLSYSILRSEDHDLRLAASWMRMDYRFDSNQWTGVSGYDATLNLLGVGAIALPGSSFQVYQIGYAPSVQWEWKFIADWSLGVEWMPPFRRRGDMHSVSFEGYAVTTPAEQRGRVNNSITDLVFITTESGLSAALQYRIGNGLSAFGSYSYRRSYYDVQSLSLGNTDFDLGSGVRLGTGPNVLQEIFFSSILSPILQPQELERQYSLGLRLELDLANL